MNAHTRTTRECSLDSLPAEIVAAIRSHIEQYKLGDIESSILICCETISSEKKAGLFRSSTETTVSANLITPSLLIIAEKKENEKPGVISGQLKNLNVQNFEDSAMFKINPDTGLNITGRYSDVTRQGTAFIGLGTGPAAEKFRKILREAIQNKWN